MQNHVRLESGGPLPWRSYPAHVDVFSGGSIRGDRLRICISDAHVLQLLMQTTQHLLALCCLLFLNWMSNKIRGGVHRLG